MDGEWRSLRRRELARIRAVSPWKLVAIYRTTCGLNELAPLPTAITWPTIIDAILDGEEAIQKAPTDNRL